MINKFLWLSALLLMSSGCSDSYDAERQMADALKRNVCDLGERENTSIQVVDNRGGRISGDLIQYQARGYWPSALAMTKKPIASKTSIVNDWVPVCNAWGYCFPVQRRYRVREDTDLTHIFGLARAPTMEEAESTALENCEAAAEQFATDNGFSPYRSSFDCKVVRKQTCAY